MDGAVAQVAAVAQPILRAMPPGATAPLILPYNAANVPILQLGLSSSTLDEQQIYDLGTNFLRTGLATVQGAQLPLPVGGKQRELVVDLDPQKLFAWGLSPADISNSLSTQNLVLPSGTAKIGRQEFPVLLNGSPDLVSGFNDPADPDRQRNYRLSARRGARARRLRTTNQPGGDERQQRRAFAGAQSAGSEHARCRLAGA